MMTEKHGEFLSYSFEDDRWDFYQDTKSEWRWKRYAGNNECVGYSHEGYKNKEDCIANAKRHGFMADEDKWELRELADKKVQIIFYPNKPYAAAITLTREEVTRLAVSLEKLK